MRHTALCLALALLPLGAGAANLGDIYSLAREHDAVWAAARQARLAGLERLPQGRAGLLPTVGLSANARRNEVEIDPGSDRGFNSRGYGLTLTQPLYRKQNLEAYEQGKLLALQADQQLRLAEQDLILRTAQAYFDLLQAQDNLAAASAQKAAIAEQLAQAKLSFEVGVATIVDTHEAQARYDLALAQEVAADNDLEVRRRALEKLIDAPAPTLARLDEGAALPAPEPRDMDVWVGQAREGGLGVALARSAEEIARREVERQRGGHFPTVDLAASHTDTRNGSFGTVTGVDTRSTVIGLEFALPLYQGGLTASRVRESVANHAKSRFDLEDARRQAALDARQTYLGVVSGQAQVAAFSQALVSGQAQLDSTKLGLEVGVRTRVDVLNAQQQIYTTRRDLAAARYQTLLSGLRLKAAAGTLAEADVEAVDRLLKE